MESKFEANLSLKRFSVFTIFILMILALKAGYSGLDISYSSGLSTPYINA